MILQARELSRTFRAGRASGPALRAVDSVSLGLPRASITSLVGESGSGKSTLARMLARLMPPTSGELLLNDQVVPAGHRRRLEYARAVQMILQDPFASLNPVHNIRYHLARPLRVHNLARPGADTDQQVTELLEKVALTPGNLFINKYPHELSGGQRQRVAIARALAVRPRVLLADEPVSMLDVSIRLGVLNLLADLREQDGLTILYITHDIASARYLADQVAVMYRGQIVESGPATEVTDSPAHPYTKLLLSAAPDPDRIAAAGSGPAGLARLAGSAGPAVTGSAEAILPGAQVPAAGAQVPAAGARTFPIGRDLGAGGCLFRDRCPHAMPVCARTAPVLAEVSTGHASRCWLHAADREPPQEGAPMAAPPG